MNSIVQNKLKVTHWLFLNASNIWAHHTSLGKKLTKPRTYAFPGAEGGFHKVVKGQTEILADTKYRGSSEIVRYQIQRNDVPQHFLVLKTNQIKISSANSQLPTRTWLSKGKFSYSKVNSKTVSARSTQVASMVPSLASTIPGQKGWANGNRWSL